MFHIARPIPFLLIAGLAAGCGGAKTEEVIKPEQPTQPPVTADSALTVIDGATGSISLEDNLTAAKKSFPPPESARETTDSDLTLPGESHYGWESDTAVFDAFAKAGKLTTISYLQKNLDAQQRQTQIDRELERFDEPTENAEGRITAAYVWRSGSQARIVVEFFSKDTKGILRVVGDESSLKERGFPLGDLSALVRAFDAGPFQ